MGTQGCKVTRIDGIDHLTQLTVTLLTIVLRSNLIHKIQNMDHLVQLEKLELYDNKIREIKHFSQFVNLR